MAGFSLYDASIGQAKSACDSFLSILNKIEASPVAASIPTARIHADMLPFHWQVDIFSNTVSKLVARTTGAEPTNDASVEQNLSAFKDRVNELKSRLEAVSRDAVDGRVKEVVAVGMGKDKPDGKMETWGYVVGYALPNMFFHLNTAYLIARKEGVELGKQDYLESFMGPKLL